MLKHLNRFHGRGSLRYVHRHGHIVKTDLLSLRYNNNPRRRSYRCAVVVSRKISHSAVIRNRVRRRVYETVRRNAPLIKEPYELVFTITGEQITALSSQQLERLVKDLLKRAKVIAHGGQTPTRDIIEPKET